MTIKKLQKAHDLIARSVSLRIDASGNRVSVFQDGLKRAKKLEENVSAFIDNPATSMADKARAAQFSYSVMSSLLRFLLDSSGEAILGPDYDMLEFARLRASTLKAAEAARVRFAQLAFHYR